MKAFFKTKKFYFLASVLILVLLWLCFFVIPLKVYFYKRGTDIPIANENIEIKLDTFCAYSPCYGPRKTYKGRTGEDGSFRMILRDILGLEKGIKGRYPDSYLGIPHFNSYFDAIVPDDKNPFHIYLTEIKDSREPMTVALGQEIYVPNVLIHSDFILRLESVDTKTDTAHFQLLLNRSHHEGIDMIQNFELKKGVPSYIPREITDSQLWVTDLSESSVVLELLAEKTTLTWNQREVDMSPELNSLDTRYKEALKYFKNAENLYSEKYPGKTVKLVPVEYYGRDRVIAIGPLDEEGKMCLESEAYLPSREGGSTIIPCLDTRTDYPYISKLIRLEFSETKY